MLSSAVVRFPVRAVLESLFLIGVPLERRTVIFLAFYLDESGTHHDSACVAVAGFVGSQERWIAFEKEWKKALDYWGLEHFHMTDFENYQGDYSAWTPSQHKERLAHLLDLISAHTMGYLGSGLMIEDYERVVPEELRRRLTPYHVLAFLCFYNGNHLIGSIADTFREVSVGLPGGLPPILAEFPTAFIYEEVGKGGGALQETYARLTRSEEIKKTLRVVSLSYQSKKNFGALQAADILAYESWKEMSRTLGSSQRRKRYPLQRMEESAKFTLWHRHSETELQHLLPNLQTLFGLDE